MSWNHKPKAPPMRGVAQGITKVFRGSDETRLALVCWSHKTVRAQVMLQYVVDCS